MKILLGTSITLYAILNLSSKLVYGWLITFLILTLILKVINDFRNKNIQARREFEKGDFERKSTQTL
jgi:hypothetical protein